MEMVQHQGGHHKDILHDTMAAYHWYSFSSLATGSKFLGSSMRPALGAASASSTSAAREVCMTHILSYCCSTQAYYKLGSEQLGMSIQAAPPVAAELAAWQGKDVRDRLGNCRLPRLFRCLPATWLDKHRGTCCCWVASTDGRSSMLLKVRCSNRRENLEDPSNASR